MSKFCANCGNSMDDSMELCPVCGAKVETPAAQPAAPSVTAVDAATGKKNKLPIIIGAVAVVAVALIVVLVMVLGGGGYEKAVDKYVAVMYEGEYSDIKDLAPDAYWEYMEEKYDDFDLEEGIEEMEEEYEERLERYEEDYGDNVKFSYEITEEDEIDEDDLKDIAKKLKERYDIDKDDVTEGYEVEFTVTIEGDDDSVDHDFEAYDYEDDDRYSYYAAVKIDGSWYLIRHTDDKATFIVDN